MSENDNGGISRRRFSTLTLGTVAGTSLAGCMGGGDGGGGDGGGGDGGGGDGDGGGGDGSGVEFTVWAGLTDDIDHQWVNEEVIPRIEENENVASASFSGYSYEDVRQNFITGARQGTPDMVEGVLEHLVEYREGDLISPVTEAAQEMDHYDGYVDSALEALTLDGELYGLPYVGNGRLLLYRQDVLEEFGYDGPPETWKEMLEMGREFTAESDNVEWGLHYTTQPASVRGFQEWISHYFQLEDSMYVAEDDGWSLQPDADTLGRVFEIYAGLFEGDTTAMNPDQRGTVSDVTDEGIVTGRVAMVPNGPWVISEIEDDVVENVAATTLPQPEEGGPGTYLEIKPVMASAHSENPDIAKQSVGAWSNPEALNVFKEMAGERQAAMIHEDIEAEFEDRFTAFNDAFAQGKGLDFVPWGSTIEAISQQRQEVIYGEKDAATAGEDLHSNLNEIAQEF